MKIELSQAELKRVDRWLAAHGEQLSRSEAVGRLLRLGLDWSEGLESVNQKQGGSEKGARLAAQAAGDRIDKAQKGGPHTEARRKKQKKKLIEMPDELKVAVAEARPRRRAS